MSITGIESLIYGVDDIAECTRFFTDFGLPLARSSDHEAVFVLAEGSKVITSVMIESNLVEGNQKLAKDLTTLTRGQSVTDACIGWDDTVSTLEVLAEAVRKRRAL